MDKIVKQSPNVKGLASSICRFLTLTATLSTLALPAMAQVASCDPEYWASLKGKAWTEAQREITQNQNLIYKPDSVLEYTCFDRYLNNLINRADDMFSESVNWGLVVGPDMLSALEGLVGDALINYITNNFAHDFLGGRSDANYDPQALQAATYGCTSMAAAWAAAKCMNFVQDGPVDRTNYEDFFALDWYLSNDPRNLPPSMTACTVDARFAINNSLALNDGQNGATEYEEEAFNMYEDEFFPQTSCAADPIPTGITVRRESFDPYEEFVCINVGCAYTPDGMSSGECSPTASSPP